MRSIVWALLLCLCVPLPARAEIAMLYWSGTKVPLETRKNIELILKDVAQQYATKNDSLDFGPLDFLHGGVNVKVHIWNEEKDDPTYYFFGEIFCHVSITLDLQDFRQRMMHEFSHLYDYTCVEQLKGIRAKTQPLLDYKMRKKMVKDPLTAYVRDNEDNETRAKKREKGYMAGPGALRPTPCSQHSTPNDCIKSFDFKKDAKLQLQSAPRNHFLDATGSYGAAIIQDRSGRIR